MNKSAASEERSLPSGHKNLKKIHENMPFGAFYQPASKMRAQRFAIREEGYFSILQGLERGWRGVGTVNPRRDLEAVIKSAASAASRKTKSSGPRSREAPRPVARALPCILVPFLEAALAADLITASKSKQRTPPKSQKPRKGFPNLFKPFQNPSRALPTSENHKKGIQKHQKGVRNFPNPSKTTKNYITRHIRIQITTF